MRQRHRKRADLVELFDTFPSGEPPSNGSGEDYLRALERQNERGPLANLPELTTDGSILPCSKYMSDRGDEES